jgi:hypothetical protein
MISIQNSFAINIGFDCVLGLVRWTASNEPTILFYKNMAANHYREILTQKYYRPWPKILEKLCQILSQ